MVFQNYALYPNMTVYDNMAFGLKLRKMKKPEIDQKVKEAAEILDITQYLERKPKALSGGQRQRVALGRAIVREPKVFLFDEPLSNLDAKLRGEMRAEILKLHKKLGTTFIYVTHDQVEAMTMGTKTNKLIGVLPTRLEEGAEIEVRFNKENPNDVTAEMIDWFPAVLLLVLGVLYAVGGVLFVVLRKKAGYYAIVEQTNDPTPIEDDGFSIEEQIEKLSKE